MTLWPSTIRRLLPLLLGGFMAACGGGGDEAPRATPTAATPHDKARASSGEPVAAFTANGWYWNPQEGGTGFMVEAQGRRAFVGFFMYEEGTGNPIWYVATGDLTHGAATGDHRLSADLLVYRGGMGLTASTWTQPTARSLGTVSIDFSGGRASVAFPGGRVMQAERFCANGPCTSNTAVAQGAPETGWYWNPAEGGRGFAVETHGGRTYMGIFHYNPDGSPVWHIASEGWPHFAGIDLYTGGQTLTSAYRRPKQDVISRLFVKPSGPCATQLQDASGLPLKVQRFVVDDTLPAADVCAALATLEDVPDIPRTTVPNMDAGDAVYGSINHAGDADAFPVYLYAQQAYTIDLLGAASRSGTLADPLLGLYDDRTLSLVAENDDRDPTTTDARIQVTVATSGYYHLRVRSSPVQAGVGSFILKVSGTYPGYRVPPPVPVSAYQGALTARLRGPVPGYVSMTLADNGTVGGVMSIQAASTQPATYEHVTLNGRITAEGLLSFGGDSPLIGSVKCTASLGGAAIHGGCGDAGMLAGDTYPRSFGYTYPIDSPASARVGQPVQVSTTGLSPPYVWDLGDGTRVRDTAPLHVYTSPGPRSIELLPDAGQGRLGLSTLMVFCADGTLCTDLDEPAPSITLDSAACTLQDIQPDRHPPYTQAPAITVSGRAAGSSDLRMVAFASGNQRKTRTEILQSLWLFRFWDQYPVRLACDGRDPCVYGPLGAFTHSTGASTAGLLRPLWESRPLTDPQTAWLYLVLYDRWYTRVVSVVEQPLTCPGYVRTPSQ